MSNKPCHEVRMGRIKAAIWENESPNGTRYNVVGGDTLWDITVRYMVARLGQDYDMFVRLTDEYEGDGTPDLRRSEIEAELLSIGDESHSENFTRMVEEKLGEWRD